MEPIQTSLHKLMQVRGMQVKDLWVAADLGGPSGVYRYLRGQRAKRVNSQSAAALEKISAVLGVSPEYWVEYRAWQAREILCQESQLVEPYYDLLLEDARLRGLRLRTEVRSNDRE